MKSTQLINSHGALHDFLLQDKIHTFMIEIIKIHRILPPFHAIFPLDNKALSTVY